MNGILQRPFSEPRRTGLTTEALWKGEDRGLITSWEVGRDFAKSEPELAERAKQGELPILPWKGGVKTPLKSGEKYGAFRYLAMWQGLRGDDLYIDLDKETSLVCARTGTKVIFTPELDKYKNS